MIDYNILQKQIRAKIIARHLNQTNRNKCVCFTSGNSAKYLRLEGIKVRAYGINEDKQPSKWYSYTEIQNIWKLFDATSGHLPFPIMNEIALELRKKLRKKFKLHKIYHIKTGSGETIICLKIAFPKINFLPYRINGYAPTSYCKHNPLNNLLIALFKTVGSTYHQKLQDK